MTEAQPEGVRRKAGELPPGLVALVHDVELNQAAWWDLARKRVIEAALWMTGGGVRSIDLSRTLRHELGVHLSASEVERLLSLHPRHVIDDKGIFRLTEAARTEFAEKLDEAERLERQAGDLFTATADQCCPELTGEATWHRFNEVLLLPMIRELGARTYEFINGQGFNVEASDHLDRFLAEYSSDVRATAQAAIVKFLDPKTEGWAQPISQRREYRTAGRNGAPLRPAPALLAVNQTGDQEVAWHRSMNRPTVDAFALT